MSLDTLRSARALALTRRDTHAQVLDGIRVAAATGFASLKIDTVVMRGVNHDELVDLLEFARTVAAEIRFIEYMDVGGATRWSMDQVVGRDEMLACLYGRQGIDLRGPLRAGASAAELQALITGGWRRRTDRGAEDRLGLRERAPSVPKSQLKQDPHLEMHTRGG